MTASPIPFLPEAAPRGTGQAPQESRPSADDRDRAAWQETYSRGEKPPQAADDARRHSSDNETLPVEDNVATPEKPVAAQTGDEAATKPALTKPADAADGKVSILVEGPEGQLDFRAATEKADTVTPPSIKAQAAEGASAKDGGASPLLATLTKDGSSSDADAPRTTRAVGEMAASAVRTRTASQQAAHTARTAGDAAAPAATGRASTGAGTAQAADLAVATPQQMGNAHRPAEQPVAAMLRDGADLTQMTADDTAVDAPRDFGKAKDALAQPGAEKLKLHAPATLAANADIKAAITTPKPQTVTAGENPLFTNGPALAEPAAAAVNLKAAPAAANGGVTHAAVQQVAEAIRVRTGEQTVTVRLDPPDLGSVSIDMTIEKGRAVQAMVSAEFADTASLLRRNLDSLQKELQAAGFGEVSVDIGPHSGQSDTAPGEETFYTHRSDATRLDEAGLMADATSPSHRTHIISNDRIDIRV